MKSNKEIEKNLDIVFNFRNALNQETDRGCALMAASFLENEIETALAERLIGNKSFLKDIFDFSGPLGTFSAKIKISYCLGIISRTTLNDLEAIRKIRNEFGHNYIPIDFDTQSIKDKIGNLKLTFYLKGDASSRNKFTNAVLGVLAAIHSEQNKGQFSEKEDLILSDEDRAKRQKEIKSVVQHILNHQNKEDGE